MKTIANHMADVLIERGIKVIGWGDYTFLDECASRCTHTTLMETHVDARHQRILNALERSDRFEKHYVKGPTAMRGRRSLRQFELVDDGYDVIRTCKQCGAELKQSSNPKTSGLYYCSRFCVSIERPEASEPLGPYIEEME